MFSKFEIDRYLIFTVFGKGVKQGVILANLVRERDFEVLKKSAKVDKVYINIYSDR